MHVPTPTSFIFVGGGDTIRVLVFIAFFSLDWSGGRGMLMAVLLIKMMPRKEYQVRYQLVKVTNACPHYYCTRAEKSALGELHHWDCLSAPEIGNK